jgi:hypothetical protein
VTIGRDPDQILIIIKAGRKPGLFDWRDGKDAAATNRLGRALAII